jgi:hypothetical protein
MSVIFSLHWFLVAAGWYFFNGILHDVFVLRAHKGTYDRDLLRLLMDGHVLIISGLVLFVSWQLARMGLVQGPVIALILAAGMIVYCLMIFPFLKSFVTLFISIMLALSCLAIITGIKTSTT